jgi:UDP-N-acetyl-2-amino-2-deoxyglucuronate dehydrogenase
MKNFAITGVAGYIAPRHLQAIKETNNNLIAAIDPHDSVGILDKFFPEASFFTEIERFDRHLNKLKRYETNNKMNYLSICSPNHLHDAHIRLALRLDADAICEKPLVIKPSNLDMLSELEFETNHRVYNVLQLRVHDSLVSLKEKFKNNQTGKKHKVRLIYITSRGPWYRYSWKGNIEKSGGIATNIGIHFFDMLIWLFGEVVNYQLHLSELDKMGGTIELKNADVAWFLSINRNDLPDNIKNKNQGTFRKITIDNDEFDFTSGFTNLHTKVYDEILNGRGFGIEEARPSIEFVYNLRNCSVSKPSEIYYDFINCLKE